MKKYLIIIGVVFSVLSVQGQQDPGYTQYMYNMNIVNPAYAGSKEGLQLNLLGRTQWVGFNGAPRTFTFNAHAPVGKNVGLGLSAIVDKAGPLSQQNISGDFSYTLKLSEGKQLALGLKAGVNLIQAPLASLNTTSSGDDAFSRNLNETAPNFGLGAYYYTDKFYVGFSIPNLLETKHFENSNGFVSKATEINHYFLTSGYVFYLKNDIKFKPSLLVRAAAGAPVSVDYSANLMFKDNIEVGLAYRFDDSAAAIFSMNVTKNLRMGYAYDYTFTNLSNVNSGTHELLLMYNFSREKSQFTRFF